MMPEIKFKTIMDLINNLPDEKSCHQYLAAQRWGGLMECPREGCGNDKAYVFKDGIRYKCSKCRKIYHAKTGTIMEDSQLPTLKWLIAMYLVLHKRGISSVQLSKDIGVTQKTAWFMLHRIRWAFGNELEEEQLSGVVEIDETFVGGKNRNRHADKKVKYTPGRSWKDKTPVMGILQRGGRLRAGVMLDVSMLSIKNKVDAHVAKGSTLMADGFTGYKPLRLHYDLQQVEHARGIYVIEDCHTNSIECAWSQLKRSIIGIYVQVNRKHLNKYVQEFVFRYNYRNLDAQGQINGIINIMDCRLTYKQLTAGWHHKRNYKAS